jgi:hypothetical protein
VHEPPTSHDSREWVARFIGDKGPVRISSQVGARATWVPDDPEADDASDRESNEFPVAHAADSAAAAASGRRTGGGLRTVTIVVLAAVALVIAVVVGIRAAGNARSHAARPLGSATTTRVEPPPASTTTPRAPESGTHAAGRTVAKSPGEAPPVADPVVPKGPYTLDTGGRHDLWMALDERARIQELTGIEGWVVPAGEPEADEYKVVLGVYRSHRRALAAAEMLMKSRTLRKVTVITLPPRSTRQ